MSLPSNFATVYGPWAVVTGASSGIGAECARQLAATGLSVVLVARRADRLTQLATELTATYSVQAKPITADLSVPAGPQAVLDATAELNVGLLVNNAGAVSMGAFTTRDLPGLAKLTALNIDATTALAHGFARRMITRNRAGAAKRAGVVFVSSMVNQPVPFLTVYTSSKAFVSSLALGLRSEWQEERVDVMSLEPGVVATEMNAHVNTAMRKDAPPVPAMPVEQCVSEGLAAFAKGMAAVAVDAASVT